MPARVYPVTQTNVVIVSETSVRNRLQTRRPGGYVWAAQDDDVSGSGGDTDQPRGYRLHVDRVSREPLLERIAASVGSIADAYDNGLVS